MPPAPHSRRARSSSHDLAWRLADGLPSMVPTRDRSHVYVELGCGHYRRAIAEALRAVAESGLILPPSLTDDVTDWLRDFKDDADYADIAALLDRIGHRRRNR